MTHNIPIMKVLRCPLINGALRHTFECTDCMYFVGTDDIYTTCKWREGG